MSPPGTCRAGRADRAIRVGSERAECVHLGDQGATDVLVQGLVPVHDQVFVAGIDEAGSEGDLARAPIAAMAKNASQQWA